MPIIRSYMCGECGHAMEVTLRADQWQEPAPVCPACEAHQMGQEFHPVAIGGSVRSKAVKIAEDIAEKDYGIADFKAEGRQGGGAANVRYKDSSSPPSNWMNINGGGMAAQAMAAGRNTRTRFGDGLDVLQSNLKNGTQPDLIEVSKRRSIKVW